MKAIILASGIGSRLTPLTKEIPKSLINLGGFTILERIIQSLIDNDITDIIITTGHLENKIKEFVRNKYPKINVTYVRNPIYEKTNYIYSLWLAKESSKDSDIILLHGDLIYDFKLMKNIVKEDKTCVLVKKGGRIPRKDFKARIKNGLVTEIGVNVSGSDVKFCAPLYKFLKPDYENLLDKIKEFVRNNKVDCYFEDAFNATTDKIKLYPLYYQKEFCMEIDDFDDFKKAEKLLKNNKENINLVKKTKNKKAIIIAGGLSSRLYPLTNNGPKCMLKVGGKTILQREIEAFRRCGVNDIVVITGYKKEKINYPDIRYCYDTGYQTPSILRGLFCAEEEMKDGFIFSYSDIIYTEDVVRKMLSNQNDVDLVVDVDWQDYYKGRTKHPIGEAENVIVREGKIIKIGKNLTAGESDGEFIGLAKFSKKGAEIFREESLRVRKEYSGKPFHEAKIFERSYLTDMFQELIDRGVNVHSAEIKKNWWEIDTDEDLEKVRKIFSKN